MKERRVKLMREFLTRERERVARKKIGERK